MYNKRHIKDLKEFTYGQYFLMMYQDILVKVTKFGPKLNFIITRSISFSKHKSMILDIHTIKALKDFAIFGHIVNNTVSNTLKMHLCIVFIP